MVRKEPNLTILTHMPTSVFTLYLKQMPVNPNCHKEQTQIRQLL